MEKQAKKLNKDILFPSIIIFSILVLLLFVCPFSPIHRYCFETDEIAYRVVSKGLLKGKIPYRDLFDHKGPLLYFVYALGLLITGGSGIGIWIVFSLINAASFYILYKIARLYFDQDVSFAGVMISIALLFLYKNTIFGSGTKPEHLVLLLILASEYIFLSRKDKFSCKDMLILGLLCGGVFMLKLNFCIYYLCFLGMFFLYQLFQKQFKSFFKNALSFLSGIAISLLPFVIFFLANGALDDLIDSYFSFNTRYASKAGYELFYFRPWIQFDAKIAINILFILALVAFTSAFLKAKEGSDTRKQLAIYMLLSIVVIGFITLPLIYRYVLTTLLPLLIWGPCMLAAYLKKHFPKWHTHIVAAFLSAVILLFYVIRISVISPLIPKEKPELEVTMEKYAEEYPHSTYMFFGNLCHSFLYDLTDEVPDFKYFYVPNFDRAPIAKLQMEAIWSSIPDVISYYRTEKLDDDEYMDKLKRGFAKFGYTLYIHDETVYVYIREDRYQHLSGNS